MNAEFNKMRTDLANNFASAGAALLDYMTIDGTKTAALAAIPESDPQQYAIAGTLAGIAAMLPKSAPGVEAMVEAERVRCPECRGTGGTMMLGDCADCNGKGYGWEPVDLAATTQASTAQAERAGWEAATKALMERAAGFRRAFGGNSEESEEIMQCVAMLNDIKPSDALTWAEKEIADLRATTATPGYAQLADALRNIRDTAYFDSSVNGLLYYREAENALAVFECRVAEPKTDIATTAADQQGDTASASGALDVDTMWEIHGVVKNAGSTRLAHKIADAIAQQGAAQAQAADGAIYARYAANGLAADARDAARYRVLREHVAPRDVSISMQVPVEDIPPEQSVEDRIDMLCDQLVCAAMAAPATSNGSKA